jgi:hypothetical protein
MKWNNVKGQLSLLYNLLLLGPDMINFGQFPASKVISNEDLNLSTTATKNLLMNLSSQTWNCYEIYDLSCKLVDTEFFEDVRPVFELASRQCSELLCIALAMFNVNLSFLFEFLFYNFLAILEFNFEGNSRQIDLWVPFGPAKFSYCSTTYLELKS